MVRRVHHKRVHHKRKHHKRRSHKRGGLGGLLKKVGRAVMPVLKQQARSAVSDYSGRALAALA